jgi:hypothetical protein
MSAPQLLANNARIDGVAALDTIAIALDDEGSIRSAQHAARLVRQRGLSLAWWIEVGRSPRLAQRLPGCVAILPEDGPWRRDFPDVRGPGQGEVVRAHPWVPILTDEAFDAQFERVRALLAGKPEADAVFLNDLQGAPSACGCGNLQCRWKLNGPGGAPPDDALGPQAAARFVAAVQTLAPRARIIPVWTGECERNDPSCGGTPCFESACWSEMRKQWAPVRESASAIALLVPYKSFGHDAPREGAVEAAWVRTALETTPRLAAGSASAPRAAPLIAILQGWDVTPEQISAQIARAEEARGGWVVAHLPIDPSFEPRISKAASSPAETPP